jgi:lysophospholipid acyltransferase (LPLAT)-like uncharacterized protein
LMPRDFADVYHFHSLERFTFLERVQIRAYGLLMYWLVKIVGMTIRFETVGTDHRKEFVEKGEPHILAYWHDRSIPAAYLFKGSGIVVLSSSSFDSEFTARCIQRFGYGIIKGSSTRGAVAGLIGMIGLMKQGYTTIFTVDGPKGPRYEAKAGPALLAKKTGKPLLPFAIECKRFWKIGSWDRLQIPKPFARAAVIYGEPIYVDAKIDDDGLEAKRAELQSSLDDLVKKGEEWRLRD